MAAQHLLPDFVQVIFDGAVGRPRLCGDAGDGLPAQPTLPYLIPSACYYLGIGHRRVLMNPRMLHVEPVGNPHETGSLWLIR